MKTEKHKTYTTNLQNFSKILKWMSKFWVAIKIKCRANLSWRAYQKRPFFWKKAVKSNARKRSHHFAPAHEIFPCNQWTVHHSFGFLVETKHEPLSRHIWFSLISTFVRSIDCPTTSVKNRVKERRAYRNREHTFTLYATHNTLQTAWFGFLFLMARVSPERICPHHHHMYRTVRCMA